MGDRPCNPKPQGLRDSRYRQPSTRLAISCITAASRLRFKMATRHKADVVAMSRESGRNAVAADWSSRTGQDGARAATVDQARKGRRSVKMKGREGMAKQGRHDTIGSRMAAEKAGLWPRCTTRNSR